MTRQTRRNLIISPTAKTRCTCHAPMLPPDADHDDYWHQHAADCALTIRWADMFGWEVALADPLFQHEVDAGLADLAAGRTVPFTDE